MRRRLSALVVAVVIVCGAFGFVLYPQIVVMGTGSLVDAPKVGIPKFTKVKTESHTTADAEWIDVVDIANNQRRVHHQLLPVSGGHAEQAGELSARNYKEPESPFRHAPLGLKIALALLIFGTSLSSFGHAIAQGRTLSANALILYTLGGVCGVMLGVAFTVRSILSA